MTPPTVIVTGSRDWTDRDAVWTALDEHRPGLVVHGGCRGADREADLWCQARSVPRRVMPAYWKRPDGSHNHRAGPERNLAMLERYPRALVLAFPGPKSRGTWHCVGAARARGMTVHVYEPQPHPTGSSES